MKRLVCCILVLFSTVGYAQQSVSGSVKTPEGKPIPYVNVVLNDGEKGVITDENGNYTIEVTGPSSSLQFSSVGYITKTIRVGNQSTINVVLQASTTNLDRVVVTALGFERKTRELGYAVQTLETEDIAEVKAVNFLNNLAGKLAGVSITRGPTGIGSSSIISIRGASSFSNNNPLFVVNGTPINNATVFNPTTEAADGFQSIDFGNGAAVVSPENVASVTVLKGPTAAALYGSRAANGVILIETKDGSQAKGLGITINTSLFVNTPFKLPEFQNEYGQGNSGEFEYVDGLGGGTNDLISYSWGPPLDEGLFIPQYDSPVYLPDGTVVRGGDTSVYGDLPITPTPFDSHPDNLKDFYRTSITTINNIAVAKDFEQGNYRLSFTDLRAESIIPGVNLDRQTVAANLSFQPSPSTKFFGFVNYANSQSDNRPANGYGSENVNYALVAWGPRSLDIENMKDYWQPGLEDVQQYSFNYTYFDNPYFTLLENRNSFERDRLFGNIGIEQALTKHIGLVFRTGMDYSDETRRLRRAYSSNRFKKGGYAEQEVFFREVNTSFLLNYKNKFGNVSFDFSIGANRLDQNASTKLAKTKSLAQPGIFSLNNAASPIQVQQFRSEKRINSFFGIAKFGYKNFLYLDITGRNDWSSALATPFSVDGTSYFYPSVAASFVLSETVELPEVFSFLQLRGSFAKVGNDTRPYQTSGAFVSQIPFNGNPTFSDQDFIPNPNLKPEETTAYEVGTDIRFFNDRLNFDFAYYSAITENQIISLPIAISSGYDFQVINAGKVRNQGLEIVLNTVPVLNENFQWNSTVNFSTNKAVVLELPQGQEGRLTLAYNRIYDSANQTVWLQVEEGGEIGDLYGTGYLRNENGDFIVTEEGRYIANNELQKLGNYNPDFILGWWNNFTYKNWQLGFLFDWHQGGILVSRTRALATVAGQLAETGYRPEEGIVAEGVVNVGTAENPEYVPNTTAISAESYYRMFYDRNHEENNVYDASYLKLRQFSIGRSFSFKDGFLGLKEGADMELAIVGRNLFAFSEIPHFDPEQYAVQGEGFVRGVEDMSYATTRSIGFTAEFKF